MAQSEDTPLELQIDSALAEYMQRCDAGEVLDREAFLALHPGLREHLLELLTAADWIESLAGPRLADMVGLSPAPAPGAEVAGRTPLLKSPSGAGRADSGPAGANPLSALDPAALQSPGNSAPLGFLGRAADVSHANSQAANAYAKAEQPPASQPPRSERPSSGAAHAERTIDETLPHGLQYASYSLLLQETLRQGASVGGEFSLDMAVSEAAEISQPNLPCRFGDYVLERVLGRGGMGVVYYGRQVQLERPVAIKMIRSGALASQEEVFRFYAEARSAARLDHPNIVTVYQCGECDGHHYFSMDFVDGTDLSKLIKTAPLDCRRAARYVRDAARAIQYAHDQGILHRDLKPANVLIDQADQVHITDFGLAKTVGTDTGLTAAGAALGTPSYMSPEQAAGRIAEQHQATDVYALGAVLFTIVTGQPPFKGSGILQTIMHVIHRPAPLTGSLRSDTPADLATIIDVCLQKSPERRYASASALADDLDRFLQGRPIQARPASSLRRAWYWVLGIPVIGAVLDHRVVEPTEAHRWVQRGIISVALMCVLMWLITMIPSSTWQGNRLPRQVRVAGGIAGGNYARLADAISHKLAQSTDCQAQVVSTWGSNDNAERLQQGKVDLALLQSDALGLANVAVVAPLYYEAVHILVKNQPELQAIADLRGRQVMLGSEKSGGRTAARLLLQRSGVELEDIEINEGDWHTLLSEPTADATIVVTQKGASDLVELLAAGDYRLLPINDSVQFALDEPMFHPVLLDSASYPLAGLPSEGIPSVATTAFLACQVETPHILVRKVLENLFSAEFVQANGVQTAEWASRWLDSTWHPAAREFFQAYQGSAAVR